MLNSLLAPLNSRENMRTKLNNEAPLSIHLTSIEPRFQGTAGITVEHSTSTVSIIECVGAHPPKAKADLDLGAKMKSGMVGDCVLR